MSSAILSTIRPYFSTLKLTKALSYRPFFSFNLESGKYKIKTAENIMELYQVFVLRYENFIENKKGIGRYFCIDIDQYDYSCDHIIIQDKENNKIIGTYRVRSTLYTDELYSQSEFNLDVFMQKRGVKLELGRACIDPAYRNGTSIDLLWKGLSRYAEISGTRYICGCSSIKTMCPQRSKAYLEMFKAMGHYSDELRVAPLENFNMRLENVELNEFWAEHRNDQELKIPPLLKSYIKVGAQVFGAPALDRDFKCIDFFTALDIQNLTPLFKRRYFDYLC